MKKIVLTALSCLLCLGILTACGGESGDKADKVSSGIESTESTTESDTSKEPIVEAEIGAILDAPEILPTVESLYVYFTYESDANDTRATSMEIAMDNTVNPEILYITDGLLKNNEVIYELSSDGFVAKYAKSVLSASFTKDTASSQTDLVGEKEEIFKLLAAVGCGFTTANPDYKYRKCESEKVPFTGDAFVYECLNGDQLSGKIWVDKGTGIIVKMTGENGEEIVIVEKIKTSNLGIPLYK